MPIPSTNYVTASGRASWPPACSIKEMGDAPLTIAERNCYFALAKLNDEHGYGSVSTGNWLRHHDHQWIEGDELQQGNG